MSTVIQVEKGILSLTPNPTQLREVLDRFPAEFEGVNGRGDLFVVGFDNVSLNLCSCIYRPHIAYQSFSSILRLQIYGKPATRKAFIRDRVYTLYEDELLEALDALGFRIVRNRGSHNDPYIERKPQTLWPRKGVQP